MRTKKDHASKGRGHFDSESKHEGQKGQKGQNLAFRADLPKAEELKNDFILPKTPKKAELRECYSPRNSVVFQTGRGL